MSSTDGTVAAVERALRARARHHRIARVVRRGALGGAIALAAAGLLLIWQASTGEQALQGTASRATGHAGPQPAADLPTGPRQDEGASQGRPLSDPHALMVMAEPARSSRLEKGTRVLAPETAPLRIVGADGTVLTLDPGSILTVVDLGAIRRFGLVRGAVQAQVSKLGRSERFIIDTADAEVEVHGTVFRVEANVPGLLCAGGSQRTRAIKRPPRAITSRVSVESGVVSVTARGQEARLFPGEIWPGSCAAVDTVGEVPQLSPSPAAPRPSLKAQNELFSAAVSAREIGDTGRALRLFERLIREYPTSSLIEGAMAARMRLLARGEPARAASAAASYLARFPDGVARTEAAAIARSAGTP